MQLINHMIILGWFPNDRWVNLLQETFMSIAPKGLDQVSIPNT